MNILYIQRYEKLCSICVIRIVMHTAVVYLKISIKQKKYIRKCSGKLHSKHMKKKSTTSKWVAL